DLSEEGCRRAPTAQQAGKTVHLAIGYSNEASGGFTRSASIETPTNITFEIDDIRLHLLCTHYDGKRKTSKDSAGITNLYTDHDTQLDLLSERSKQNVIG